MRQNRRSPLPLPGPAPFPLPSLYVFSFYSSPLSRTLLASQSFAEITAKDIGRGARPYPERAGDAAFGRSGNTHEKAIHGPHQLTRFLGSHRTHTHTHTHTLLRRLITAGDFHSLHGEPRIEGGSKKNNNHHRIPQPSDFTHEHDVSRRTTDPPRGDQPKKFTSQPRRQLPPSKAPKIIIIL
jgi:hypothetical protein